MKNGVLLFVGVSFSLFSMEEGAPGEEQKVKSARIKLVQKSRLEKQEKASKGEPHNEEKLYLQRSPKKKIARSPVVVRKIGNETGR